MNLTVRKALSADAEHIALLGWVTFRETFGPYFTNRTDLATYLQNTFNVAKIRTGLLKENNVFWLALVDELPVGFAKLKRVSHTDALRDGQPAQLQKIYVLSDFLAQKVGAALYEALLTEVRASSATDLWLVVLQANGRAIRFYEKQEFVGVGPTQFTIGSQTFDFLLMNKVLTP